MRKRGSLEDKVKPSGGDVDNRAHQERKELGEESKTDEGKDERCKSTV